MIEKMLCVDVKTLKTLILLPSEWKPWKSLMLRIHDQMSLKIPYIQKCADWWCRDLNWEWAAFTLLYPQETHPDCNKTVHAIVYNPFRWNRVFTYPFFCEICTNVMLRKTYKLQMAS